jgi:DNA polymerase-3 subunit beta
LRFGDVEMLSKLVEGKFPDYQRVIPKGYRSGCCWQRDVLAASLAARLDPHLRQVPRRASGAVAGTMRIQTSNAEQEEALEELEVDYSGETLDIGFNVSYLQDVLGNLKTEQVAIDVRRPQQQRAAHVPGDESFKYVVMPMRI